MPVTQLTCKLNFSQTTDNLQTYYFCIYVKTTSTFQMKVYSGCCGLSLKIPVSNAQAFAYLPIVSPIMKLWYAEIADWCAFIVRYWRPSSNRVDKQFTILLKGAQNWSIFSLTHQLVHLFQANLWLPIELGLLDWDISLAALLKIPSISRDFL